ncbi:multifunctional CCA addition/repair protein [Paraferrimonas sedimenticola]|uniref:Multifunctional CCA protein n=1 Tax=Paraferrimonas sedimenticola TaxID=375674 RepID=A0AA37W1E0_9GAMM|nr:multifunctional CCA addition/repair protein [Paraferrimonas sedimenticola]GLP97240.1 multifunctional CCA protein [Paraferrimonas sedimenticola]
MKTYLVGGAVRDQLLGIPYKDKDYVVVGASVEQMLADGYQQVGRDFPVFLHPETQQEHALARTERKSGQGYTGFICEFGPDVTLEQDLIRRDLTINAIAQDDNGELFDPYGGQQDIKDKRLRHVSNAFSEDPLRVLRVARFAARFAHLGFRVDPSTMALMRSMSESGELSSLTAERVWQELQGGLQAKSPRVFFEVLRDCGALQVVLPEVDALFGVPQPEQWHPEIDTGLHTLLCIEAAGLLTDDLATRFAVLCHDLGKALTPSEHWPKHHGHGQLGLKPIKGLCQRLKAPNECRDIALLVSDQHGNVHKARELRPSTLLKLFDKGDFWRKPQRLQQLLIACEADSKGRTGFESEPYPQKAYLEQAFAIANQIPVQEVINAGFKGREIREELTRRREQALSTYKASHSAAG